MNVGQSITFRQGAAAATNIQIGYNDWVPSDNRD